MRRTMNYSKPADAAEYRRVGVWCVVASCMLMPWLSSTTQAGEASTSFRPDAEARLDRVNRAIERGIAKIYATPPPRSLIPTSTRIRNVVAYGTTFQGLLATGYHAAANRALLACGQSYQNPRLLRRINLVLASDTPYVFARGMRAQMLAELPPHRWSPWIHRDGVFLAGALTEVGGFNRYQVGDVAKGFGDNAHAIYGALGLAGLERAGWEKLGKRQWSKIDAYWRSGQERTDGDTPAGWAIASLDPRNFTATTGGVGYYERIRSSMTVGAAAVLYVTERSLRGKQLGGAGQKISRELRKALAWLDSRLKLDDPAEELGQYFYYYMIQNLGHYTGYRTFNGVDWYQQITDRILNEQKPDGRWEGLRFEWEVYGGEDRTVRDRWLLSTSFALLYLSRANDPLAISKIRWKTKARVKVTETDDAGKIKVKFVDGKADANWNNRPHDMWNFVDHVSDLYEVPATWQVVELDLPVREMIESPLMYLSTDGAFRFTDEQLDRLRDYIDAGGLLIVNPEGGGGAVGQSVHRLAKRLFAGRGLKLEKIPADHAIRHVHAKNIHTPMMMVHNGVRPLMILFTRDIGLDLQKFNTQGPNFQTLSNIYLYVTGLKPQRPRLAGHYAVPLHESPLRKLSMARIRHGGNYDPEPQALGQLKTILANEHDVDATIDVVTPSQLHGQSIAFLTAVEQFKLTESGIAALRRWIEAGGTLWIDVAGGSSAAGVSQGELIARLAPGATVKPLAMSDPVVTGHRLGGYNCSQVKYRAFAVRKMGVVNVPRLETVEIGGRPAIIFTSLDLTAALAGLDHWDIFGYSPESARRLVVNGCLAAERRGAKVEVRSSK